MTNKQIIFVLNSSDQIVLMDIADQKDFICVVYCGTSTFEHSNVSLALNTCVQLHSSQHPNGRVCGYREGVVMLVGVSHVLLALAGLSEK